MPEKWVLRQYQALPLSAKITMSQNRIREWYEHWNGDVVISFSGGKDSTVLAHLVHDLYPKVPMIFANTGLEYPEIQAFAKEMGAIFIRPKMSFAEVITKYGYPIISKENAEVIHGARIIKNGSAPQKKWMGKPRSNGEWMNWRRKALHGIAPFDKGMYCKTKYLRLAQETDFNIGRYCCDIMKKAPLTGTYKEKGLYPYVGTLTEESKLREQAWIRNGCNAYEVVHATSQPLSFWTEQDILSYIKQYNLKICSVYGDIIDADSKLVCSGYSRTDFIFCGFGVQLEKGETRFQQLAKTHPRQYEYCLYGGHYIDNPDYDPNAPEYDDFWKNWNPKQIWVPSKEGLGMKHVFDACNEIYGKDFIRY